MVNQTQFPGMEKENLDRKKGSSSNTLILPRIN